VAGKLQAELQQRVPFQTVAEEALLNVMRTADLLEASITEALKPFGLSPTQYNVLRILRGAGCDGICCKEVAERMVTPDPDVTRLMDRLEKRNLLTRDRAKEDRRFVTIRLTQEGLDLTNGLDQPIREFIRQKLGRIPDPELLDMIRVLEKIREEQD
jgi:DNA-binding MarR family transcriptional regulator